MDSKQVSKMKSLDIKMEKTNAMLKYRRLHKITTLFRFMEIIVFLVMISKLSSELPFSVKVFGDYFRGITFTVLSPKFVFVIGNVIILILFFKSRALENKDGNKDGEKSEDLCYEYVKSCESSVVNSTSVTLTTVHPSPPPSTVIVPINKRKISRSRSEDPIRAELQENQTHRELRRSVTEMSRSRNFGHGDGDRAATGKSYLEDELSCEDFRRTVEAFIARQQKILRDEEFSPMVYIGSENHSD